LPIRIKEYTYILRIVTNTVFFTFLLNFNGRQQFNNCDLFSDLSEDKCGEESDKVDDLVYYNVIMAPKFINGQLHSNQSKII